MFNISSYLSYFHLNDVFPLFLYTVVSVISGYHCHSYRTLTLNFMVTFSMLMKQSGIGSPCSDLTFFLVALWV